MFVNQAAKTTVQIDTSLTQTVDVTGLAIKWWGISKAEDVCFVFDNGIISLDHLHTTGEGYNTWTRFSDVDLKGVRVVSEHNTDQKVLFCKPGSC